jgi:hypothetical protein
MTGVFNQGEYGHKAQDVVSNDISPRRETPSKFKLGWFLLFSILALGLTIAVSFSCSTVATSNLYMYSIRPGVLIQGLADSSNTTSRSNNSSSNTTNHLSPADFGLANLPDQYLFGISGLCRRWDRTDVTKCQYHFPQDPSLLAAVLQDSPSPLVREHWTQLLTSPNTSPPHKTTPWARYATAASALLITSILWALGTILFTLLQPHHLTYSICLDIVDFVIALAAVILWSIITSQQTNALKAAITPGLTSNKMLNQTFGLGPGFACLWGLAWCKAMVTPIMLLLFLFVTLVLPLLCCAACLDDERDKVKVELWGPGGRRVVTQGRYCSY